MNKILNVICVHVVLHVAFVTFPRRQRTFSKEDSFVK